MLKNAEQRQAKQQQSLVVSLSNEVLGTREQDKAFAVMDKLNLQVWPSKESEVNILKERWRIVFQHLTAARRLFEDAGNEESRHKVLAMQKVELDLAIRLHVNDKVLELLTKHHEDAKGSMSGGLPFICIAAAANNTEGMQLLISRGADVNTTCQQGNTPLHFAVMAQALNVLRSLSEFRNCNPNKKNLLDRAALHESIIAKQDLPTARNIRSMWKSSRSLAIARSISSVSTANAQEQHLEALTVLLKSFPRLNPNLPFGPFAQTALHLAAEMGNSKAVNELLQHPKVDANARDKKGRSPLMAGIWQMKSVQVLLENDKVNVNAVLQEKGWSVCHVCVVKNNMIAMAELLASPRVDLSIEDNMGWTPMHLAMHENSLQGVKMLLQSPAMQQDGFRLCHLMRTANALRHSGDPSSTGLWDQATPDILERLPDLLLDSRQWEFLHDVLCNIAFLSAIINSFGLDYAVDLFETTVMAVKRWSGVRGPIVSEMERYKMALQTKKCELRDGTVEFSLVAFDESLWGVKAMKIVVEQVVDAMIAVGKNAKGNTVPHEQSATQFLKLHNPLKRIRANGLLRLVNNSSELPEAEAAVRSTFTNQDDTYIKLELARILREEARENFTEQAHQRAVGQLASLLEVFGKRETFKAIKLVLDTPMELLSVQQIRSQICVTFHRLVESIGNIHMRVLRTFGHMGKTSLVLMVTKSPFHYASVMDEDMFERAIKRIIDKFTHEDDLHIKQLKNDLKIVSISRSSPSTFVIFEILCPQELLRRFRSVQDFEKQVLDDVMFCCNAKKHLLRICRTSCTWNTVVIEFLHDDLWTKTDRSFQQASKVVEEAGVPDSNLRKGVMTSHVVSARCTKSTVPPLVNGEWKDANLQTIGLESDMHNEKTFLEKYVLPAIQVLGVDKRCNFSWSHWSADQEPIEVQSQLHTTLASVQSDERETDNSFTFVREVIF